MDFKKIFSNELLLDDKQLKYFESLSNETIGKWLKKYDDFSNFTKNFETAMNLQICFIMDISGSMETHSTFTNKAIGLILDSLLDFMNKNSRKRYAFIGYTERDETNHLCYDFTEDIDEIREIMKNVNLTGGGDVPEDIEHALSEFCNNINFNQGGTRIIIHIADAPCHGKDYNNFKDDHPDWSNNIPVYLKRIVNTFNCSYWFVKVTDHTDKMIAKFNEILKQVAPHSEQNEIIEMDLRNLKSDMIKQLIQTKVFESTLFTMLMMSKK